MLAETGKAAVIHPTGTGKSFIGFKLCEDNPDKTVCWLSPSEYIFRTQFETLKKTGAEVPQNIKFFTYSKLTYMSDEKLAEIAPDIVVLDEYHRGSAVVWQKRLMKFLNMYAKIPILGLTATNVRYLDNQRGMAEELFDGNIASEMTLDEAIVRGILKAPMYVSTAFSYQKELEKYTRMVKKPKYMAVREKAQKHLDEIRISKLNALNMRWESISDMNWEKNYTAAVEYAEKYGEFNSKANYVTENGINLTEPRTAILSDIGSADRKRTLLTLS